MRQIDMSAEAVTARLKLVSQLRRLCLSLGTAKVEGASETRQKEEQQSQKARKKSK